MAITDPAIFFLSVIVRDIREKGSHGILNTCLKFYSLYHTDIMQTLYMKKWNFINFRIKCAGIYLKYDAYHGMNINIPDKLERMLFCGALKTPTSVKLLGAINKSCIAVIHLDWLLMYQWIDIVDILWYNSTICWILMRQRCQLHPAQLTRCKSMCSII